MLTKLGWQWWGAVALIVISAGFSAYAWTRFPETVPTHWNIEGKVDGYGSKALPTLLMPGTMVLILILFSFMPALSPKNFEVESFHDTLVYVLFVTEGLFGYLHAAILYGTWSSMQGQPTIDLGRLLFAGIFLFFGLLGNVLGKIRRNFYIGVRVPWTLASDRVWNDTHRFAAWSMVGGGILGFLTVVTGLSIFLSVAILLISIFGPIVYSFVHYKKLERLGEL